MNGYASKNNAAALAGVAVTDIANYQAISVDRYVELMLGRSFEELEHTQYFDVPSGGLDTLQVMHWPLTSVTRFRDNQRGSNPQDIVEDEDFTVDYQAGIFKLIKDDYNILKGSTSLTVGTKTVAITYKWGYVEIPDDVKLFADWMLAWIAEIKKVTDGVRTADGAILRRVQIGDYQEAYDTGNQLIDKKYKGLLADMTSMLVTKYKFWGEVDGNYFPST